NRGMLISVVIIRICPRRLSAIPRMTCLRGSRISLRETTTVLARLPLPRAFSRPGCDSILLFVIILVRRTRHGIYLRGAANVLPSAPPSTDVQLTICIHDERFGASRFRLPVPLPGPGPARTGVERD